MQVKEAVSMCALCEKMPDTILHYVLNMGFLNTYLVGHRNIKKYRTRKRNT